MRGTAQDAKVPGLAEDHRIPARPGAREGWTYTTDADGRIGQDLPALPLTEARPARIGLAIAG